MPYRKSLLTLFHIVLLALLISVPASSQENPQSGTTPSGIAPGSPSGSYQLSAIDNINYFNGNLNLTFPVKVSDSRGDTAYQPVFNQDMTWSVWRWDANPYPGGFPNYVYEPMRSYGNVPMFNPGFLEQNIGGFQWAACSEEGPPPTAKFRFTSNRLHFTDSNGTRYELVDALRNGQSFEWGSNPCYPEPTGQLRGRVWKTADGTAITFYADQSIGENDWGHAVGGGMDGYLFFPDGQKYRIEYGRTVWIEDRNGNRTTFSYSSQYSSVLTSVIDSLGRVVTFQHDVNEGQPYGTCSRVTSKGFSGEDRIVRICRKTFGDLLRSDVNQQDAAFIFDNYPNTFALQQPILSDIWLPDGRRYQFRYNKYAEISRIDLPTGGAFEYDYGAGESGTADGWVIDGTQFGYINRRVTAKRIYDENNVLISTTTISAFSQTTGVLVSTYSASQDLLSQTRHYYHGEPNFLRGVWDGTEFTGWREGKEYKTEKYAEDGTSVLEKIETIWSQTPVSWCPSCTGDAGPSNNPKISRVTRTLPISGQDLVSKVEYVYDEFNNITDTYSYDFGVGQPGSLLRRESISYVNSSTYTGYTGAHLRRLPATAWVSSDAAGNNKLSYAQFEYDNYSYSSTHSPLVNRTNVTGHNSTNYGTSYTHRGNLTERKAYANAVSQTGPVSTYSQFDILGNVVKTLDGNGNISTFDYTDRFGSPDGEATSNTAPSQIGGDSTFALATGRTNALNWTTYQQFDYFTGLPVNSEDFNGRVSKVSYNDPLDRPTQTIRAVGTSQETQTTVEYDDANRRIEKTSDLYTLNDNLAKSETFYDGFGRTKQTRTYSEGDYVAAEVEYDALGRVMKTSNPYRPTRGETLLWTQTTYDTLSRVIEVETPDGAKVKTAYDGNRTLVADQADKKRISKTNALEQLKDIWEVTASDGATVPVTFPGSLGTGVGHGYQTSYSYDSNNNLIAVSQGTQTRTFAYDSLSRLTSAVNPESGTISYTYDSIGNLKTRRDARNIKTVYDYDPLGRVVERCYRSIGGGSLGMTTCVSNNEPVEPHTSDVNYTYEDVGMTNLKAVLTKVTNGTSTTEYTDFDILGRVTGHKQTTDGQQYVTGYTYNLSGALMEQTYPSGRVVKNTLDADGSLSQLQSKRSGETYRNYANGFIYNAAGAVTAMRLGNGLWENTTFNSRLQPTQIGLGSGAASQNKLKLAYSYGTTNNNGNILGQTVTVPSVAHPFVQEYTYDSLNRISSAEETSNSVQTWKQAYVFDRYGNRTFDESQTTTIEKNCGISPNFVVCTPDVPTINPTASTSNNRLNGTIYDAAGNVIEDAEGRQFKYDAENKQVEVENSSSQIVGQYYFDGEGKRVKKIVPGTGEVTVFVYDSVGKLIGEYSTVVRSSQDAKTQYLTNDHLGTPRINTDSTGQIVSRSDYMPYGEEIVGIGGRSSGQGYVIDDVRHGFTGYEKDDETGLEYAQARMYAGSIGRFTTVDPIKMKKSRMLDPQRVNLYAYVRNNPLMFVDKTGTDLVLAKNLDEKKREFIVNNLARLYMTEKGRKDLERADGSPFIIEVGRGKLERKEKNPPKLGETVIGGTVKVTGGLTTYDTYTDTKTNETYLSAQSPISENANPIRVAVDKDNSSEMGKDPAKVLEHEIGGHVNSVLDRAERKDPNTGEMGFIITGIDPKKDEENARAQENQIKDLPNKPSVEAIKAIEEMLKKREHPK